MKQTKELMNKITLNGDIYKCPIGQNIHELLVQLDLDPAKVAVECNLAIVPHSLFTQSVVQEGDRVEIVRFIGGG